MKQVPGYTLVRTEDCPEQHGTLTVLTHDVSGATILLVENEDNNKAFGIGFGTFPSDDTGVFHILEHSVLAGSEKYPVTSPFLQLLKSSMASFLNAMTFPDKTVYPFATPNETDFRNLMDVYLNAVFCPLAMVDSGVLDQLSGTFSLSWWTAIPALLILILPLCKVPIRPTMAVSALTALLVTVFAQGRALLPTLRDAVLGYLPAPGALHDVLSGGGMMSMVSATIMAVSAGLYAGLLGGMGVLNGAAHLAQRLARRAGRFPACAAISVVCSMVFCNQSTCAVVCNQLLEDDYTKRGHGRGEMALDVENSGIVLSPLIPWNISVSIPLAMLGADMSAIPYEILLYAIPLCYWLTKRRVYPPKGDDCHDTIAEPLAHS